MSHVFELPPAAPRRARKTTTKRAPKRKIQRKPSNGASIRYNGSEKCGKPYTCPRAYRKEDIVSLCEKKNIETHKKNGKSKIQKSKEELIEALKAYDENQNFVDETFFDSSSRKAIKGKNKYSTPTNKRLVQPKVTVVPSSRVNPQKSIRTGTGVKLSSKPTRKQVIQPVIQPFIPMKATLVDFSSDSESSESEEEAYDSEEAHHSRKAKVTVEPSSRVYPMNPPKIHQVNRPEASGSEPEDTDTKEETIVSHPMGYYHPTWRNKVNQPFIPIEATLDDSWSESEANDTVSDTGSLYTDTEDEFEEIDNVAPIKKK
jgi:hypothetical protein